MPKNDKIFSTVVGGRLKTAQFKGNPSYDDN